MEIPCEGVGVLARELFGLFLGEAVDALVGNNMDFDEDKALGGNPCKPSNCMKLCGGARLTYIGGSEFVGVDAVDVGITV